MTVDLDDIRALVAQQLGRIEVAPDDRLVEDLAAESGDLVVLLADLEERYDIAVDEAEIAELRTVADLFRLVTAHRARS